MKKIIAGLSMLALTSMAFAQSNTTATNIESKKQPNGSLLKGGTIGFTKGLKPNFKSRVKSDFASASETENTSQAIALKLGYQDIRYKKIGWSAFAHLGSYEDESSGNDNGEDSLSYTRLSINATFGITDKAYAYGGLNQNRMEDLNVDGYNIDMDPEIGIQIGGGYIVNENLSLTLAYYQVANRGKVTVAETVEIAMGSSTAEVLVIEDVRVSTDISALELGMTYTF